MIQILILVAAFGLGAYVGWDYRDSKVAQEVAKAQGAAIEAHNEDAAIDMAAAREAGERDALAKTRFATARSNANEAIRAAPLAATCNWDKPSFDGLLVAIKEANGDSKSAASGLSDAVTRANKPAK